MSLSRASQQTLRSFRIRSSILSRTLPPFALALNSSPILKQIQTRLSTTTSPTPKPSLSPLARQRLNRPTSPHLSIYAPQIPWILSITNRLTGAVLSGGLYIFGFTYLISPLLGISMSSASMAAAFGGLPLMVKAGIKFFVAWPGVFHSVNGVRHLVWDVGGGFLNKSVVKSGWVVVGVSLLGAVGLVVAF